MKNKIFILTVLVFLLTSLAVPATGSRLSQTGVSIYIDGPRQVFVNHTEYFIVEVRGSFAEEAINWSIEIQDVPDGLHVEPLSDESTTSNMFQINVTALQKDSYKLNIAGYCSDGLEVRYRESTLDIEALTPVTTRVDLKSPVDYTLENVVIGLFIDDELMKTQTIDRLEANETRNIEMIWGKEKLDEGEHTLEIWVDYGFNGQEDFKQGERLLHTTFYVEGTPGMLIVVLPIVIIIIGALLVIYYLRRRKKRRRPW
ncbi:MAG: hypothetical protein R6U17_02350 [Thermoplasmata archaeon]